MHWELAANVSTMKRAMELAHSQRAGLCAFAELALTGFHRRIGEWAKPELVGPAVIEVQAAAESLGLAVAFGAPTFARALAAGSHAVSGTRNGRPFNSHLFVHGAGGRTRGAAPGRAVGSPGALAGVVSKAGLTAPEATFFAPGVGRPVVRLSVGNQCTLACSAVICREVEDHEAVVGQLAGSGVELILWPGQMRPDPDMPVQDPPQHVVQAQALARATGAWVVQTNWPNALNRPEESEQTGHSACIAPSGELLFRLPRQGFGVGVFTLGERRFEWCPMQG